VIGDDRDELVLHVRLVSIDEFEVCGEKCSVGFSVVASELGASPLIVETLLYRESSKASCLATYNGEPFFSFKYEKIQKKDLEGLFPALMRHLEENLVEIKQRIQEAKEAVLKKENINEILRVLRSEKGLGERFHTLLFQEVEKNEVKTRWDLANRMAILAKDFSVDKRLKIERAAGILINLAFNKN
jgi:hypothetical protein